MTQLQIINLALRHLGMQTLNNLNANNPSTQVMNEFWAVCRDVVFREHQWGFANVQQALTAYTGTVPSGWLFAYDYPTANVATVWTVYNEGTLEDKDAQDFDCLYIPDENKKIIVSDLDAALADVTWIITDPTEWDAKFCHALSYNLAASSASFLTADLNKATTLMALYGTFIADVKRIDAVERRKKAKLSSTYQNARG
jgi:hypothetical protein